MHHLVLQSMLWGLLIGKIEHERASLKRCSTTAALNVLLVLRSAAYYTRPLVPIRLLVKKEYLVE